MGDGLRPGLPQQIFRASDGVGIAAMHREQNAAFGNTPLVAPGARFVDSGRVDGVKPSTDRTT